MKAIVHKSEWGDADRTLIMGTDETLELSDNYTLGDLQFLVGGNIELVHYEGKHLIVNEEGRLKGLPLNLWADNRGLHLVGNVVELEGFLN